jgi:hypothetical protein
MKVWDSGAIVAGGRMIMRGSVAHPGPDSIYCHRLAGEFKNEQLRAN